MKKFQLFLLSLTILMVPQLAVANGGIDDFNQKKYDSAFRKLLPNADAGQPAAMFYLGRIFIEGLGSAPKDTSKGQSYISRSADKNYEPALKFLAQNAERSGNLKSALGYYERLRSNGDISTVEKIAEINEHLYNKDRELTASYCTSLDNAKTLNKKYNELRYVNCIMDGKIPGKTLPDGYALLKALADKGNDTAAVQLAPYMLTARNDKNWDPAYVDALFFKNIDNSKILEQLKNSISKSDLNFEICRFSIPGSTFQQQNYRASICRLAAVKGDTKAAQFVAERHLIGYDGFPQDIKKANFFIESLDAGATKIELKLYAFQLAKNFSEHLNLLIANTNIDLGKMNEALDFQIMHMVSKANLNELTAPSEIAPKAKLINEFGDCKLKTELSNFLDKYFLKDATIEEEYRLAVDKFKPDTNCAGQVVERPRRGGVVPRATPPASTRIDNQTAQLLTTAPPKPAIATAPSLQTNNAEQPVKIEFPMLLDLCDKKEIKSCLAAVDLISNREALKEVSDEGSRIKIMLDLLDKAASFGSLDAKYRIYDLLSPIRFPINFGYQKLQDLLLEFEKIKTDSATIRLIHDSVLSFNPISNILQTLAGRMRDNCTQAKILIIKPSVSVVEKMYLNAVLNSINCKSPNQ